MPIIVKKITEPLVLGEAPHWDDHQQALFFVSIRECTIHKYLPATGEHTMTKLGGLVGFIIPVDGTTDQFVVGVDRKFLIIQWDGKNNSQAKIVRELFEVDPNNPKNRINDGKADPRGRLYAGTMGSRDASGNFEPEAGSLYCVEGEKITKIDSRITLSNGLAFDLDAKAMYYIDSMEYNIRRYDYDVETGKISNMKHIFDVKKNGYDGIPDGTTIDTDGNLWLAIFNCSCLLKVNPKTGKILQKVDIPALQVTSATFGGPNHDILFVTTARISSSEEQKPLCGCVFMITGLGVKGHPNKNFKL